MTVPVVIAGTALVCVRPYGGESKASASLADLDFASQILSRSEQRAQGLSQLIASYLAGCALDDAGLKGDVDSLADMALFVATRSGERDEAFDETALAALSHSAAPGPDLNRHLANLRPSLFLAQLENLFAANISINFGVLGPSITFVGGVGAGMGAIEQGWLRISEGRSSLALVGGVFNGLRANVREFYEAAPAMDGRVGAATQAADARYPLGAGGAFLVLEAGDHARNRGKADRPRLSVMREIVDMRAPGALAALPQVDHIQIDTLGLEIDKPLQRQLASVCEDLVPRNDSLATGGLMEGALPVALALTTRTIARQGGSGLALCLTRDGDGAAAVVEEGL